MVPDIIYIPFDPDNPENLKSRHRLLTEFTNTGWKLLGSTSFRDGAVSITIHSDNFVDQFIYVYILRKEA